MGGSTPGHLDIRIHERACGNGEIAGFAQSIVAQMGEHPSTRHTWCTIHLKDSGAGMSARLATGQRAEGMEYREDEPSSQLGTVQSAFDTDAIE